MCNAIDLLRLLNIEKRKLKEKCWNPFNKLDLVIWKVSVISKIDFKPQEYGKSRMKIAFLPQIFVFQIDL